MEGFQKELGVGEEEALDLIGRSVTLAKEARQQYKVKFKNILCSISTVFCQSANLSLPIRVKEKF